MKTRNYNRDAVYKMILLSGFAVFFFFSVKTGSVLKYVHPRNIPFIKFAMVAMLVIAILLMPEVLKPQRVLVKSRSLILFLIPLTMAISIPAESMEYSKLDYGNFILENSRGNDDALTADMTYSDAPEYFDRSYEEALCLFEGTIVMDDNNYFQWIQEIYENMDQYLGKKIQVTGFVFKSEQFDEDLFVPARMMMTCCVADMQPIGLLCVYDQVASLEDGDWIQVRGTLGMRDFEGVSSPVIIASVVEEAVKPEIDYIYPF